MDGLGESGEVVAGVAGFFKEVDGRGLSREEEHLALRELAGQGDGEIDAAHSGHDDVGDEELGSDPEGEGEGTGAIVGCVGFETALRENDGEGVGDDPFVVDDENYGTGLEGGSVVFRNFRERNHVEFDSGSHGDNLKFHSSPIRKMRVNSFISVSCG